jgi:hypothetical protein
MISAFLSQSRLPEIDPSFFTSWLAVLLLFGGFCLMILTGFVTWLNLVEKLRSRNKGDKKEALEISPNPLQVQEVEMLATRSELAAMGASLEADIEALKKAIDGERNVARTANGTIHKRIDEVVETLAETKGLMTGVKDNTDLLLSMLLNKPTKG